MSGTWPLYSTQAARALDQRAMRALGGDAYVLMQRAGQVAWQHVLQHWPEAQRIVVVCGPGSMAQGHKPDEFISVAQLAACDRMLERVLAFVRQ